MQPFRGQIVSNSGSKHLAVASCLLTGRNFQQEANLQLAKKDKMDCFSVFGVLAKSACRSRSLSAFIEGSGKKESCRNI